MKYFAFVAALLSSAALAAPVTQEGTGSKSNSFQISAAVGDACRMSQPSDVTIPVMYWTQADSTVTGTTSVKVECNTGAMFRVDFDDQKSGQSAQITLNNSASNPLSGAHTLSATVTGQSAGNEISGDGNGANTLAGYTKTLTVTVNKPEQANIQGSYTGTVNVVLSVLAPSVPPIN